MQQSAFAALGWDISRFHPATLNISIAPWTYEPLTPIFSVRGLHWCPVAPPEDFSFFQCRVRWRAEPPREGLVYRPHPETKPEHFQDPTTLEILTEWLDGLRYGDAIVLELPADQIRLRTAKTSLVDADGKAGADADAAAKGRQAFGPLIADDTAAIGIE